MAVKQPNMKAADSPIVMKAGDTAARETAAKNAVEATINETPEVASALAARGITATYDSNNRAYVELAGTTDEIHAIGEYLTSYQPARNAFLNALVNRIGLTIVTSKLYRNPWAVFKRGYLEFGDTIEEIFVNLADVHGFYPEGAEDTFAKRELPDVRTAFHRMNFQKFYKTTVSSQQLRQAFLSWTGVSDLIARIIESLYTSANTDEYYVMRYFLAKCLLNGYIGSVEIPEVGKDNAVDIATQFQYMSDLFQYQSTKYNMAGVTTHTDFEDQYFIVTAKFKATMNMNVLATAFNLEYREFQARMITVDTFTDFDWVRMDALFTDPATGQLPPLHARGDRAARDRAGGAGVARMVDGAGQLRGVRAVVQRRRAVLEPLAPCVEDHQLLAVRTGGRLHPDRPDHHEGDGHAGDRHPFQGRGSAAERGRGRHRHREQGRAVDGDRRRCIRNDRHQRRVPTCGGQRDGDDAHRHGNLHPGRNEDGQLHHHRHRIAYVLPRAGFVSRPPFRRM